MKCLGRDRMKRLLIIALLLLLLLATPVYAYTPPGQSSDNATDIILWHGDNVTIESANITGGVEITGDVVVTGEVEITGLTESNERIAADFLAFIIVAFIIAIVLAKGGVILYALGVPVALVYGFVTASEQEVYSPLWVAGVAIGILGLYFLYQIGADVMGRKKK